MPRGANTAGFGGPHGADLRRFHVRPGVKLRRWEREFFLAMHDTDPVRRLWAHVIEDALCGVYRRRRVNADDLAWLLEPEGAGLLPFAVLAAYFNVDAADVRRDLMSDIHEGRIHV